jgi:MarR family transcriptional regulator, organic hydroperoxide resistance regulator
MKKGMDNIISLISAIRRKSNELIISEMAGHNIKGLVTSHGDILAALFEKKVLSMKEIAERIGRDKSTVTALINKLIKFGYVKKQSDPQDSRIVLVALTNKGRALQTDFYEISGKLLSTVYKGISDSEKMAVSAILNKIKQNF